MGVGFSRLTLIFIGFSAPVVGSSSIQSSQLDYAGDSRLKSLIQSSQPGHCKRLPKLSNMAKVGSRDCRRWLDGSSLHINAARDVHRSPTPFGLGIVFQVALRAHLTTASPGCHWVSSRTPRLHHYGFRPVGNVCGSSRPPPGHPFWQVTDARGMFSYSPEGWCLSGTDRGVGVTLLFCVNYDMYASSRAAGSLVTGWIAGGAEARLRCSFCLRQGRYVVHLLYRWLIWKSRGTKGNDTCCAP